jgi:hypothetical protein
VAREIYAGTGLFMAVIIEVIGAATLEFFGDEHYMPTIYSVVFATPSPCTMKRDIWICVSRCTMNFQEGA